MTGRNIALPGEISPLAGARSEMTVKSLSLWAQTRGRVLNQTDVIG